MKLINKISTIVLGAAMAAAVGVSVGNSAKELKAAEEFEAPEGTAVNWVPIESPNDINTTDPFLIGYKLDNGTRYFCTNSISSSTLGVDSNFANAKVVRFENADEGYYVKLSSSKYLTNSSGTGCSASAGSNWTVDGLLYLVNLSNSNRILARTSKDAGAGFKAYATNNVPASNPPAVIYKYDSSKVQVDVDGVSLDLTQKTILVGESFDLTATVSPAGATDDSVSWTSSNEGVATVEDGHVSALAVGETTITVTTTDGGFTATCNVTVDKNPYDFDTLTSALFTATGTGYTPFDGKTSLSRAVYKGSTNKQGDGSFAIKASTFGVYTTKTGGLIKSISIEMGAGSSASAKYVVYGSNSPIESEEDLSKLSSVIIASTNESKTVEPESNFQYFAIKSTSGAPQIKSVIVKWEPVKPLSIDADDTVTLTVGRSETLDYTLVNNDLIVTETDVEFSSSDNSAVSVSETGLVAGVSVGTANVTIKSKANENVTKTIAVTVSPKIPVTSVTLDQTELVIKETHTEQLSATVLPEEASIKEVTWSSSDKSVATVDQDGKVTGVKAGTATIRVESTDDDTKYAERTVTVVEREVVEFSDVTADYNLVEGGKYIVVGVKDNVSYVMGHYASGSNVKASSVILNTESVPTAVKEEVESCYYTLVANDDGTWSFFDGSKYLYAASGANASNNYMKSTDIINENAKFTITFDDAGLVSVVAQGDAVNKNMRFNSGSSLFSCYGVDTEGKVKMDQIYLYTVAEESLTAEGVAQSFMMATNMICPADDAELNRGAALAGMWGTFKNAYEGLGQNEQDKFLAEEPSPIIKAMLERYDYIVTKYSLENYIVGHVVSNVRTGFIVPNNNNNSAVVAIIVVSIVSITSLGVLITIKKRKALNK